jgi:hypothetical protein
MHSFSNIPQIATEHFLCRDTVSDPGDMVPAMWSSSYNEQMGGIRWQLLYRVVRFLIRKVLGVTGYLFQKKAWVL